MLTRGGSKPLIPLGMFGDVKGSKTMRSNRFDAEQQICYI